MRAEDGQYADALTKRHPVLLLNTETTGALGDALAMHLRLLGRLATAPGTQDSTVYGEARSSTRAFFRHHAGAISAAIVLADATTLLNAAASMSFGLTFAPAARA